MKHNEAMHLHTLCRERLASIQRLLQRHGGTLSVRDFARTFSVWEWELEQAAALGWLEIEIRKPRTGRPSRIARQVSKCKPQNLPPYRSQIEKPIRTRHFNFALKSLQTFKHGRRGFMPMPPMVDAYQQAYPAARNRRAAAACASRLLNHPDVKAARAWWRAQIRQEIPLSEPMPETASGIRWRMIEIQAARFNSSAQCAF